jgi:hypothetical protein
MENSILVEPEAVFVERGADVEDEMFAFKEADVFIYDQLRAGPMPLTTVLNVTDRLLPSRSKRQKLAIKREILRRLGTLIRRRRLRRIKRGHLALPTVRL